MHNLIKGEGTNTLCTREHFRGILLTDNSQHFYIIRCKNEVYFICFTSDTLAGGMLKNPTCGSWAPSISSTISNKPTEINEVSAHPGVFDLWSGTVAAEEQPGALTERKSHPDQHRGCVSCAMLSSLFDMTELTVFWQNSFPALPNGSHHVLCFTN